LGIFAELKAICCTALSERLILMLRFSLADERHQAHQRQEREDVWPRHRHLP